MEIIKFACDTEVRLKDLEHAGISYVPCGEVDGKDQPLLKFSSLWGKQKRIRRETYGKKWNAYSTQGMTGVQIMTGKPTYKRVGRTGYFYYTSIDIERRMLELFPDTVAQIRKLYEDSVIGTPCVIKTKSDGLRLDAYTEYVGKKMSFKDAEQKMLFEILADKCLARIDARYAIVSGSILDMPTLPKVVLQEIYHLVMGVATHEQTDRKPREVVEKSKIGYLDIEWDADGRSQLFPTAHCQRTSHSSNRDEVRFTKYSDGSVDGKCFNCGESWWEIEPPKPKRKSKTCIEPVKTLPPDHPIIASAPTIEIRERPSFRHFSTEERAVVRYVLSLDPDAGWHGKTPVFTTRYEYLHPLTNKFALNGQPSEVEKRRVWSTLFGNCEICGAVTAQWLDRFLLTAGLYCDGCHKDYPIGSYLEIELNRKLPNSIISEHQGFLGDDPDFADFRLWQPGTLTHLGAGMATGKSTEIYKAMIALAMQGLGKGIIAVPRVSLARFLAHRLRKHNGKNAWGLWHEGCRRDDKFIGDFGAIVCLPSLPQAVKSATDAGVERLYIAIDEVDFGYNLLSLSVEQATAVKKCLRDALASTGLAVSGQTESTLALEALADELECEQVQGFYNTAKPAEGTVVMKKHPNTEGKSASIVCGGIDDITDALAADHNVYTFCSSRRDGDVIADVFQDENPVIYNAYMKGNPRSDAILRKQRLTDSRLFIGTSAAGVGISILDPKARTVIASGLNYGSRDASMVVQECVRDRGRRGVSINYADYDLPLPVRPTENEKVSIYHESLKEYTENSTHGIRKIAYAQALASLADSQIQAFVGYHLGTIGNMLVSHETLSECDPERIASISARRTEIRREEREKRIAAAINLLSQPYLLTTSEIRVLSTQNKLSPENRLAHETANATAQAVGWDDKIHGYENSQPVKEIPDAEALHIAIGLTEKNIDADKLSKQRRGYIAVNFPKWTDYYLQDDRFRGELITALLDRLTGKIFDSASLAKVVREVLQSLSASGKSFGNEILSGALGASDYRKARFLHIADADSVVDWARSLISEWYPARIAKSDDSYALCHAEKLDLRIASFSYWLTQQPCVPDGAKIEFGIFETTELPDPNAELKVKAREHRNAGGLLKDIAIDLDVPLPTVSRWCEGITPAKPKAIQAIEMETLGISRKDIAQQLGVSDRTLRRWLNT